MNRREVIAGGTALVVAASIPVAALARRSDWPFEHADDRLNQDAYFTFHDGITLPAVWHSGGGGGLRPLCTSYVVGNSKAERVVKAVGEKQTICYCGRKPDIVAYKPAPLQVVLDGNLRVGDWFGRIRGPYRPDRDFMVDFYLGQVPPPFPWPWRYADEQ